MKIKSCSEYNEYIKQLIEDLKEKNIEESIINEKVRQEELRFIKGLHRNAFKYALLDYFKNNVYITNEFLILSLDSFLELRSLKAKKDNLIKSEINDKIGEKEKSLSNKESTLRTIEWNLQMREWKCEIIENNLEEYEEKKNKLDEINEKIKEGRHKASSDLNKAKQLFEKLIDDELLRYTDKYDISDERNLGYLIGIKKVKKTGSTIISQLAAEELEEECILNQEK